MKNTFFYILMAVAMLAQNISAQREIIKLWPDGVPGSIQDDTYIEEPVKGKDNITRIYRVKDPEMIVYPAPADKATGAAVIICPGGGYHILAIDHEGYNVAEWLSSLGITTFVLKYRLPSDKIMKDKRIGPLQDAQRAMRIVRKDAKKWNVDKNKIGIMGFSAGGHLASTLSTHYDQNVYPAETNISAKPDFSILIYPVISMDPDITHMGSRTNLLGKEPTKDDVILFSNEKVITRDTPMAYLALAADDKTVPIENSINYFLALKRYDIPAELHIYEKGGHGFGMKKKNGTVDYWTLDCEHWLRMHKLIK